MPDERLNGDSDTPISDLEDTQTTEQLQATLKTLGELKGEDGTVVSLSPQQLGILKQLLHPPPKDAVLTDILLICDFLGEEEADDIVAAYYEAKRLGMDTQFNIDHALSRASCNRKGGHQNSRSALIMDTMSHTKFTSNQPRQRSNNATNPRSPLS